MRVILLGAQGLLPGVALVIAVEAGGHDIRARILAAFATGLQMLGRAPEGVGKAGRETVAGTQLARPANPHGGVAVKTEAALVLIGGGAVALEGFLGHGRLS